MIPLAWSLDCPGPMARRLLDVSLLLGVMAGVDPSDPTTVDAAAGPYPTAAPGGLTGVRIGLPDRYFWDGLDAGVERVAREALERLAGLGAEIVEVAMPPSTDELFGEKLGPLEKTIIVEAAGWHRPLMETKGPLYSPEVLSLLQVGETVPAPDYADFQYRRAMWGREWRQAFADARLDAVASPTVPAPPGLQTLSQDAFAGPSFDLTKPWSFNGFPALSVPVGLDGLGLPVGLQLAGLPLAEARLLEIGIALDEDVAFYRRRPPIVG